jgi:hypothetical protein
VTFRLTGKQWNSWLLLGRPSPTLNTLVPMPPLDDRVVGR